MNDFSTAAVIRLIELGLRRQGLNAPLSIRTKGAHVPLQNKRALLSTLLEQYGPICLLRMGEAIKDAPDEPILLAMRLAHNPHDLIERWQRLERYAHSRHRTICLRSKPGQMVLRHTSLKDDEPPLPAENLLIAGVLAGFIELIGATALSVRIGGEVGLSAKGSQWSGDYRTTDNADWEFSWENEMSHSAEQPSNVPCKNWLTTVRNQLEADPGRRWTVDVLARTLGMSSRSFQRRFRQEGSGFSQTLGSVRLACSAELLAGSKNSPAEIGYACGYSDQAHFTREFKRQTAFTPIAYRENFE